MIVIESPNRQYRATLREIEGGVEVSIFDRGLPSRIAKHAGKLIKQATIDEAFHVVLDAVYCTVRDLP